MMTALERFYQTLRLQPTDRRSCMPLVFGYAANLAGVDFHAAISQSEALVQSQLVAQRNFGYDGVYVFGGNALEVESMGVPLVFPPGDYPYVDPSYVSTPLEQWLERKLPDPSQDGRLPALVQAAKVLQREVGRSLPVVGVVTGPFSIAVQLMGLEKMLYGLVDQPQLMQQFLDQVTKVSETFALALIRAGAPVIMLMDPASSQNIITPGVFRKFSLPLIQRIFGDCQRAGAKACWLTITGEIKGFLPDYPSTGAQLATVDYEVSLAKALELLPEQAIHGSLRPFDFVERGPEEIRQQCRDLLQLTQGRPGFILGSGCELPPNTKEENLAAMLSLL